MPAYPNKDARPAAPVAVSPAVFQIASGATPVVSPPTPTKARWVSPVPVSTTILRTAATVPQGLVRQGKTQKGPIDDERPEFQVQVDPPGIERLGRLDSDRKLEERIRQETLERTKNEQIVFPEEPILSRDPYRGRVGLWPTREMVVEPYHVAYQKLFFQQVNVERFGWDLGPITPLLCSGKFLFDLATVPMKIGARPCERDASTGYPLPGDPVPLLLYPPEITVTGVVLEAGVIAAFAAIFP